MQHFLPLLCLLLLGAPGRPDEGDTDWLSSNHPRITVKFGHDLKTECVVDCARYVFIVNYRSSDHASSEELTEWNSVRQTSCIDIVLPGKTSFACKQASSLAGIAKNGQRYAILRFRLKPEQAGALTAALAVVRLRNVSFQLSEAGRSTLTQFLLVDARPTSD